MKVSEELFDEMLDIIYRCGIEWDNYDYNEENIENLRQAINNFNDLDNFKGCMILVPNAWLQIRLTKGYNNLYDK